MGEATDDGSSGDALLTALVAPVVRVEHAAFEDRAAGADRLFGRGQAQPIELAEGIEIGRGEGSVGHVEVFQMASVGTSIFGRPRRLSPDRRAHTAIDRYTLICEDPMMALAGIRHLPPLLPTRWHRTCGDEIA
ncbi:Hypothetical protein PFCIRM527_04440 [Propionibacterium freudenreichii]|nr:Hypothetical protein PFCIRM527_04440 [Propionibacterium freudenreichii]